MFINVSSLLIDGGIVSNEYSQLIGNGTGIGISNISDFSQRTRRHMNFLDPATYLLQCRKYESFANVEETCEFVKKSQSCNNVAHRIDYLQIMVCLFGLGFGDSFHYDILICGLFIILLVAIYAYALVKFFILPNCIFISRAIHIPPFQCGVIVMALLLAAPQLLLLINVCQTSANGTLIVSGTLGRAFSCYATGMATIGLYQKQVKLPGKPFILTMGLAIFALVFTIITLEEKLHNDNRPPDEQLFFNIKYYASFAMMLYAAIILFIIAVFWNRERRHTSLRTTRYSDFQDTRGWRFLVHPFNPYDNVNASKTVLTIILPFWIVSALQVPVVDRNMPQHGWSKVLLCVNFLIFPTQLWMQLFDMKLFYFTLGVCIVIATFVFIFTNFYIKPRYHGLVAIVGAFMGFSLLHILDQEMNVLQLQVTSYVSNLPSDVSTILGYSSCFIIFTVIICVALMEVDEASLAVGFVNGIVMSEMLTLLPSVIFHKCYDSTIQIGVSAHAQTCVVFLLVMFFSSLLSVILTDFVWRRSQGWFILLFFIAFLFNILLSAFEIIHPYGTHHHVSHIYEYEGALWA